jgi:hypothetical protein
MSLTIRVRWEHADLGSGRTAQRKRIMSQGVRQPRLVCG